MSDKSKGKSDKHVSRRQFIQNLSYSLLGAKIASDSKTPFSAVLNRTKPDEPVKMKYRVLGRTGLKLSEISLGGHYDGMGWRKKGSDKQSKRNEVFKNAIKLGVNFFDSNEVYESKTIGTALKDVDAQRSKIYLSADTNAYRNEENYLKKNKMFDEIFKEVNEHIEALQTSYIDLFRLTTWSNAFNKDGIRNAVEAFKILKKEGKARFFGISNHNPKTLFRIIDEIPEVNALFIPYSYITTRAEKVFPTAKKKGIGVICIKPFVKGSLFKLSDKDLAKMEGVMGDWVRESNAKRENLNAGTKQSLALANLKFILSNKNITTIIPGMETAEEVAENVRASHEGAITEQETGLLRGFWDNPDGEELVNKMCSGKYHFLRQWRS